MSTEQPLLPCCECAEKKSSCCVNMEVYLTPGDVMRIHNVTKADDFLVFKPPGIKYAEAGKEWFKRISRPDGCRRVLRSMDDGACFFLTQSGCRLSLEQRPLLCRIFPIEFDEQNLLDIANECPLSLMKDPNLSLIKMGMTFEKLIDWHAQLYEEINQEKF